MRLAEELREALDDPKRYEWGDYPWEHLGDAEKDVRVLLDGIATLQARLAEAENASSAFEEQADIQEVRADEAERKLAEVEAERDAIHEELLADFHDQRQRREAAEERERQALVAHAHESQRANNFERAKLVAEARGRELEEALNAALANKAQWWEKADEALASEPSQCPECGRDLHGYRGPLCRYCDPVADCE